MHNPQFTVGQSKVRNEVERNENCFQVELAFLRSRLGEIIFNEKASTLKRTCNLPTNPEFLFSLHRRQLFTLHLRAAAKN